MVRERASDRSEKSGKLLIVKPTGIECVSVPAVAVMTGVAGPRGAFPETVTFTVVFPDVVIV